MALDAQVEQAEARVRIQQIAIERQRLLIKTLADRFERQKTMFSQKLIDEDSYEALESELSLAKVDLRSLQESLAQSRAALDQALELLSKTRIKSPIDGLVIQVDIKEGETILKYGHDIGKAVDHEIEGGHPEIGAVLVASELTTPLLQQALVLNAAGPPVLLSSETSRKRPLPSLRYRKLRS